MTSTVLLLCLACFKVADTLAVRSFALTPSIGWTARAVGPWASAVDGLDEEEVDPRLSSRAQLRDQRQAEGGAALASANWGAWRVRAPTNATARARHVLVDSEEKAIQLLKELTFGAEIGQLAAQHSQCPSKEKGGDLGEFKPGDMVEEFESFVFDASSPIGVPLGPVRTPFGYHVIIIDERTDD